MKKFLILSAFGLLATLGFHQSAMANCYCPQGVLVGQYCTQPDGRGGLAPFASAICPASPRQSKYDTPPPPVTKDICEARPQGGKACLKVYISDPNYKFKLTETNAQGNIVYFRDYHIDGDTIKAESYFNQDSIRHGVFKTFHENGQPKGLGNFVNGQLQGEYKIFDTNGQIIKIEHYKDHETILEIAYQNGKKHGQEIEYGYLDNGKKGLTAYISRTAQWVNGIKHGEEKFFEATNKKGKTKLVKTVMWQNGKALAN